MSIFGNCIIREAGEVKKVKNFSDTYVYNKTDIEKKLFEYMMTCEYVDRSNPSYKDLEYDIKRRQITTSLIKILSSNGVKLCIGNTALPRAFKVMVAKDIRGDKSLKVFIDVTDIISLKDGNYVYRSQDLSILMAYLLTAMNSKIYYTDISKVNNRNAMVTAGAECFANMVFHIIDYLRLASGISKAKEKILYYCSMYYQISLLQKEPTDSVKSLARKIAGFTDNEAQITDIFIEDIKDPYLNLETFIASLNAILQTSRLTMEVFVEKWMFLYGTGTQYALELYPSFAAMIIHAYVGDYQNNQKTIEKVVGGTGMVDFVNSLFKLGSELIG